MERIVMTIQGLSGGDDLAQLHQALKQGTDVLMAASAQDLNDALSVLDPARHALGWLFILWAKASKRQDAANFVEQAIRFLRNAPREHIILAPEKYIMVALSFVECVMTSRQPIRAVAPLATAIRRFRPTPEHITPLHPEFLKVCILSKCYKHALPLLDEPATEAAPKMTGVDVLQVLTYHYYGGIVYCSQKRFKDALYFFQLALSVPASAVSAVMVEAYKKFVLVSLIVNGQVATLPKHVSAHLVRSIRAHCEPYNELERAFGKRDPQALRVVAHDRMAQFQDDNNVGLVKKCLEIVFHANIQRLTQTYLTLSLADIASTVHLRGPAEAESYVLRMIENKEIFARIDQVAGMVSFHDDPEEYDSVETVERIEAHVRRAREVFATMKRRDDHIAVSSHYLSKTAQMERGGNFDEADLDMDTKGADL